MTSFLNARTSAWVAMASVAGLLFVAQAPVLSAQEITASDVEQAVRTLFAAWNSGDPMRFAELDLQTTGSGFGYRNRAPRAGGRSQEERLLRLRAFFSSKDYFRIELDEIHTAVDGDVGLAWGFFTEDFQVRGQEPEKVQVRFTFTLKRDADGWRNLLYHRDVQPFDEEGSYIPTPVARE